MSGIGSLDFLSKTKSAQMQKMGGATQPQAGGAAKQSLFAQQSDKAGEAKGGVKISDTASKDLMKSVYGAEKPEIQDKSDGKEKDMVLPAVVEYGNEKYSGYGKDDKAIIDDICKKTGDSKSKVESELKRKYGNTKGASGAGTSLNMQA